MSRIRYTTPSGFGMGACPQSQGGASLALGFVIQPLRGFDTDKMTIGRNTMSRCQKLHTAPPLWMLVCVLFFGAWAAPARAQQADLSITKTDGVTSAIPGQSVTYTIKVRNLAGPDGATGATVVDNFPTGLSCLWTCQAVGGGSCTPGQAAGNINDTVLLPAGATLTYTAVCDIDPGATGTLANTATVTPPPGTTDPAPGNNSASDLDTVLAPSANLSITKTDNRTTAVPGQDTVTYAIVVRNQSGPSDLLDATVTDTFPASLSCLWTCAATGGGSCTPGQVVGNIVDTVDLPVGARLTYTAQCSINPMATGTLANTASVAVPAGASDPNPSNNSASDLNTVLTPRLDARITKTDGVTQATPGETLTYTIVASNPLGPSGITGATVLDTFPAPLDCDWSCVGAGGATCTAGPSSGDLADLVTLPVGGMATYTAVCAIDPLATGTLSNTATITVPAGVVDTNGGNNLATDANTVLVPRVDTMITVDDGVTSAVPGTSVTYQIVASNPVALFATGPLPPADGASLDDSPAGLYRVDERTGAPRLLGPITGPVADDPAGPSLAAAVCTALRFTADGALVARCASERDEPMLLVLDPLRGSGRPFSGVFPDEVVGTPGEETSLAPHETRHPLDGRILSLVRLDNGPLGESTFLGQIDPTSETVDVVGPTAPGLVTLAFAPLGEVTNPLTGDPGSGVLGRNVVGAQVTDTFPTVLDCVWTCIAGGGASCTPGPVAGNIADTVNLPLGASVIYTAQCAIDPAASGNLTNTAILTPPATVEEIDPNNNTASDTDTLTPQADLTASKTDGVTSATPGGTVTYTLVAANPMGPSDIVDATVTDLFPTGLSCIWSCLPSGGASCTQGQTAGNVADTIDLPVGGRATYTATCAIAPGTIGTLANTVTVAVPAGATDPVPGNNSASDLDTQLVPVADLAITKTDGVTSAVPGESISYTVAVSNPSGPSNVVGALVSDAVPSTLDCTWTCAPSAGASCNAGPIAGNLADTPSLAVGASVVYSGVCSIDSAATGTLANTATVAPPAGASDPNGVNNAASDLNTVLVRRADLTIVKDDGRTEAVVGASTTYTLEVGNLGPSDVVGARVRDTPPATLDCLWTCVPTPGASCTAGPTAGALDDTVNLPVGALLTYTGVCDISTAAVGTLSNTATVAVPTGVTEVDAANNSSTDTDTLIFEVDLAITKTNGSTTVVAGEDTTYTLVVSNDGPSPANDAQVLDVFPPSLDCQWTCAETGGGSCTTGPGTGDIEDIIDLPVGANITYTAVCAVNPAALGMLVNTAMVTPADGVTELVPANNTATDSDEILVVTDLAITKTDGVTEAVPGQSVTYTMVVTNDGPSFAMGATVSDTFLAELSCQWECLPQNGGLCTLGPVAGNLVDSVDLPRGGRLTYTAECQIDAAAKGFLSNTATVAAQDGGSDPNLANNTATDDDTELLPMAVLTVSKSDGLTQVVAGTATVYTITIANPTGPSSVRDVSVVDLFPDTLTCVWTCAAAAGASCTPGPIAGDIVDSVALPIGGNITYTAACNIDSSAVGVLSNTVTAEIATGGTFSDSDSTTLIFEADLEISKTDNRDTTIAGSTTTYSVIARNPTGPSDVRGATVRDEPPFGISSCSWTCTASGGASCFAGTQTGILKHLVDLPVGSQALYTGSCVVAPTFLGPLVNTATITLPEGTTELDPDDNSAHDVTEVTALHDLALDKRGFPETTFPGDQVLYTLDVSNAGPSAAHQVIVVDQLPSDVSLLGTEVELYSRGVLIFRDGFESGDTSIWDLGLEAGECRVDPPPANDEGNDLPGDIVTCHVGMVPPGFIARVQILTLVDPAAEVEIVNNALVFAATEEIEPLDDTDMLITPVNPNPPEPPEEGGSP